VQDNQAPNAVCNNYSVTLPSDGSSVDLPVSQLATASTDNCASNLTFQTTFTECNPLCVDFIVSTLTLDCDNVGTRNYGIKVKDDNGNTSTCTATLTVIDTSTPTAICQNKTVQLNNNGNASITPESINNGSTSLCELTFELDQSTFDCSDVDNPVTVTLTATDNNMNFSTCTAVVTVEDNIAPVAECQDQTVQLDTNGEASIMPSQVDNNSSDNCDDLSFSLDQTTFNCDDVGSPVSVELTVTDGSNLFATCTATITVEDNVAPNANCQNLTIALDANGAANITTSQIDDNSSDNCGAVSLSLNQTSFDCSEVGDNTVTLTVTDANGNSSSCDATVTVQDNIMPNAICQDVSVQLDNNGEASITTDQVNNGSNDACGGLSFGLSQMIFDCNEVGNNTVTLTVTDENGNSSTCDATVSVADNMMPDAQCQDITIQLDNNGAASITTDQINNGSSDNCATISLSLNQTSFDCNNVGNNTVTLTVTDANGNSSSCDATVSIEDDSAPIASCKNLTANLNNAGSLEITADQINNGSSDNCGAVSLSLNQTSFDCSEVGNNTVTLTVTDANGNSSTCDATVTVQDNTNPTALCQNVTAVLDGNGDASVTAEQVNNGSFDNCGTISLSLNQTDFDCAQVGAVTVTLTVTDNNENSSTCDATIMIEDNTIPTALCINPTIQLDDNGLATITPLHIDNGSYDNCEVDELSIDNKNFDCSNVGSNTVILTVLDVNGNSSTCTSTLTIEDNVAPLANCKDITVGLDETGNIIVDGQEVDNVSWDACGIDTYVLDINTFDCTDLGDNPVTLTVTDNNGNSNSCNATITIVDNTMPDLVCLNPTVYLDANGQYTLSESEVFAGGTDNCGTVNFDQLAPANLDCSDIGGVVMVRVEANDGNGNGNSCVANVTVLDNINPIAVCNNTTVTFNGESDIQLLASDLLNQAASSDNCDAYSITTADPIIICDQLGTDVNITIEIADNSGNVGTCTSTITVEGLPCNWSNDGGIGCIDNSVSFTTNGDVFTLTSNNCSAPFPYSEDQIAFVSQELCGDGEIIALVKDVQGDGYGGLMIRETEAPNARKVALSTNRVSKLLKEVRVLDSYPAWPQQVFSLDKFWIKINRTGSIFKAYASVDGTNWIPYIFQNMQMDACVRVGLFTYSQVPNTSVTSIFEFVSIGSGIPLNGLPSDFAKSENLKSQENIQVFPNPTTDVLNIDLSSFIDQEVNIRLYNNLGQLVINQNIDRLNDNIKQLDVSTLSSGSYHLQLKIDDQIFSEKVLITKD
jgi:hypothetical protein